MLRNEFGSLTYFEGYDPSRKYAVLQDRPVSKTKLTKYRNIGYLDIESNFWLSLKPYVPLAPWPTKYEMEERIFDIAINQGMSFKLFCIQDQDNMK